MTEVYFIFFDDPAMPHKEVSHEEYHHYQPGMHYPVLTAARSGIQIDGFMNYELF